MEVFWPAASTNSRIEARARICNDRSATKLTGTLGRRRFHAKPCSSCKLDNRSAALEGDSLLQGCVFNTRRVEMTLMKAPVIRDRRAHAARPLTTASLEIMTDTLYARFLLLPLVLVFWMVAPLSLQGQTG